MKILVCISKTPDTTAKISFKDGNTRFNSDGVQYIMNPYDEWYALVRALELTENSGGSVTVINVGPADNETIIRKALAIGANDAVRVDGDPISTEFVAAQIAAYASDKGFDAIFLGKETIDYNNAEVGAMVAELLNLPYISFVNNFEVNGNSAVVSREIEGGSEIAEVSLPLVISAAKGMAEQRIPNMKGIMMAKSKPLQVIPAVNVDNLVSIEMFDLPPAKAGVKMVDPANMDELVRLLHEEARVI